ncbi:hypothetical protein [Streptomyces chrestomyceticus]|uniref:hypothetical protein n=1 Tax=Streptomyces chrestomyceticus TaxID=68185 RepID=UPI0033C5A160
MHTLFRALIDQREWKAFPAFRSRYQQAAKEVAAAEDNNPALKALTLSDATFERWYYGTHTPRGDARRVLVHMFGYSIDELWAQAPAQLPPAHPHGAAATDTSADDGAHLQQMGRQAAMAARRAMQFAIGAEHGQIGEETMGYVQDRVRDLAARYTRVPLAEILDDLTETQEQTFTLLEGDRATPDQSRDLYLLSALTSGMYAKACHDLADPASAMMHARAASVCATKAGHTPMQAWVSGLKSLITYWAGEPGRALHFARSAAKTAEGQRGSVTVWAASLEARAAALLGDEETVRQANRRATELREFCEPDELDALGGLLVFPKVRQDYYEVEAKVLLGHGDARLVAQAEETVRGYSDPTDAHWAFGDAAGAQTDLALARLYTAELDGAMEAVRPVLDLPLRQRNAGIVYSVNRVAGQLSTGYGRDSVAARDLREEIETFGRLRPLTLPR